MMDEWKDGAEKTLNAGRFACRHRPPHDASSGFTLLELMVVISIIIMLAATLVTAGMYAHKLVMIHVTENTINMIRVEEAVAAAAPVKAEAEAEAAPAGERIHEVIRGDTLSGIAKKYYGKAGLYNKIFEANRDILDDPNLIKVGQKLRIPE